MREKLEAAERAAMLARGYSKTEGGFRSDHNQ
jgi:hypothetical protein